MRDRIKVKQIVFALVGIALISLNALPCFGSAKDYASLPPFISSNTKANVVFVVDFSGSMQDPAYYSSSWDGYYSTWVSDDGDRNEVVTNYTSSTTYYGYFNSDKYYKYDSTNKWWEEDTATTYSNRQTGNKDSLSGNLLNFLITTRVDAVMKNLIGGKAVCPSGQSYCILKPQGARRWVQVSNLNLDAHIRPKDYSSDFYGTEDMQISVENDDGGGSSAIGTFSNRYARLKINASDRKGIIQENFDAVRFSFIAYAMDYNTTAREGLIKYGFHQNDQSALVTAIESAIPYGGTDTGNALEEAYYYLAQSSSRASYNSSYISAGTSKDPYYELQDGSYEPAVCRKSFVVLISDGLYSTGTADPMGPAYDLHTKDLRTSASFPGDQNASVFSLFAFSDDTDGEESMKTVAAYGNFDELSGCDTNRPYTFDSLSSGSPTASKDYSYFRSNCPNNNSNACCAEWDAEDRNGVPDAFYKADDGQAMANALTDIFEEIRQGTSSGTAVTALTSRVSSGAVIAQAAFYPKKTFSDSKEVLWTGDVFTEWFLNAYIADVNGDLQLVQNIREDTNSNFELNVLSDRILEYLIENDSLRIDAFDSNQYGEKADATVDKTYTAIENVKNLFDSGELLRVREPSDRTIYGVAEDNTMKDFTTANRSSFDSLLGTTASEYPTCLVSSSTPQYDDLIQYTRGEEITNCRPRITDASTSENVWKLGDIIYSSPTIVEYKNYSMIYVSSNSGMLHAFRLGYIKNQTNVLNPAKLCEDSSASACGVTKLGKEEWAFIPKDVMPYLRYLADPDYDHMYTLDLKPYIISAGSKIILIGGMRFGGGTENGTINPPTDTNPNGRSAYFALDITDPMNPKYLWKYAPDGMGFTYSGPAFVRRKDSTGNWKYFVMFVSGPTTYEGRSTQKLEIYTVDALTGTELNVFGDQNSEMNKRNAFGGRLFTDGLDVNEDGQTDFVFVGYTDTASGAYSKMKGGIIKVWTGDSDATKWNYDTSFLTFAANPITAPVRTMKCFPDQLPFPYLYFGTGRYFVPDDQTQDSTNDINHLYGVPFIYDANNSRITGGANINSANNSSSLTCSNVNSISTNPQQASWKIPLEGASGDYLRERSYSDPTTTDFNVVFFDTAKPISKVCETGGLSRTWIVNCASGQSIGSTLCTGTVAYKVDSLTFKYLVQLSGGDIQQHEESEFTENSDRTTAWKQGVPAEQGGLPIFPPGSILGQILYWRQL